MTIREHWEEINDTPDLKFGFYTGSVFGILAGLFVSYLVVEKIFSPITDYFAELVGTLLAIAALIATIYFLVRKGGYVIGGGVISLALGHDIGAGLAKQGNKVDGANTGALVGVGLFIFLIVVLVIIATMIGQLLGAIVGYCLGAILAVAISLAAGGAVWGVITFCWMFIVSAIYALGAKLSDKLEERRKNKIGRSRSLVRVGGQRRRYQNVYPQ